MPKKNARHERESDDWLSRIRESSHEVVLAGLASLTRAQGADQKGAPADFKTLLAEGRKLEPELQDTARRIWEDWTSKPGRIMALGPQSNLRSVFDERVAAVLARLGVPSGEEVAELRAKVDRLLAREGAASRPAPEDEAKGRARARAAPRQRRAAGRPADGQAARRRPARD
ncbi:MAG: phasin family protein [Steroidobacteraceae bacterium]|nr:phasin family protein [Steroidobacteraceae bacterium]MBP7012688.1 phasin family protein [Steroidobacteraceae bacterium]